MEIFRLNITIYPLYNTSQFKLNLMREVLSIFHEKSEDNRKVFLSFHALATNLTFMFGFLQKFFF